MLRPEDVQDVIEAVESHARDLSDWESEFMDSIRRQWDDRGTLTEKQMEKLDQVFEKRVGR